MVASISAQLASTFTAPGRARPAPAQAAGKAAAPDSAPAVPALLDETESLIRGMREEFLARRLDTAQKIVEAIRPYQSLATTARTARPMAVTLGFVAREVESVVTEMNGELSRRMAPSRPAGAPGVQPEDGAFAGLEGLAKTAERVMENTSIVLRGIAWVHDPDPLDRGTVLSVAVESSKPLLSAWDTLKAFNSRLGLARNPVNLRA